MSNPAYYSGGLMKPEKEQKSKNKREEERKRRALIKECFLVAKPECWRCGQKPVNGWTIDLDHIKNRSQGGSDDPINLQLLCRNPFTHKGCHPEKPGVPWPT